MRFLFLLFALLASPASAGTSLTGINQPQRITLADTNNDCLTLPAGTDYLRLKPISTAATLEINGTDGGAVGSNYESLAADTVEYRAVHMYSRSGSVCIAGSAAAVVEVTPLSRGK